MASSTAADLLVERLLDWDVEVVFGLPGDGINGIMEALRQRAERIRFVQLRHEESAAFMACAYAKYTGRLGVCLATSGPGGLHLLNGLYDAKLDGQPVLAITGLQYHDLIGTYTQQDVELDKVFADVAKFNERIMGPAHVEISSTWPAAARLRTAGCRISPSRWTCSPRRASGRFAAQHSAPQLGRGCSKRAAAGKARVESRCGNPECRTQGDDSGGTRRPGCDR
jgi:2-succinyl-5-enolpyruvyl-6-hydroxy-3-cyclohexene-1-carboxylate synthase